MTGSADGTGSAARFNQLRGIAADRAGNVYAIDSVSNFAGTGATIRKITSAGVVTTVAGSPTSYGSDDGTGSVARFNNPFAVAADASGTIYVADTDNHAIRKITPAGLVTTFAGSPLLNGSNDGAGTAARFNLPRGVATDRSGNVYVADMGNSTIRKITSDGVVTTFAGSPGIAGSTDGTGTDARFVRPMDVATDGSGNVYVAHADFYVGEDTGATIRKITTAATVTTLAGTPLGWGFVDGTGSAARFFRPSGVAADRSGNVYVADSGNNAIRKITAAGIVTTLAGTFLYGSTDGTGSAARFASPTRVATDSADNIYVADSSNHTIRKITPAGAVTTLAGSAGQAGNVDGTGSIARFVRPEGVATDSSGNVYVADYGNRTVRKITLAGTVTTVGGAPSNFGGVADGTGNAARFHHLLGVATDISGNIYLVDESSIRVGRPALADSATIDMAIGTVGATRQLNAFPQTATRWQWSIIRRPSASSATLSSSSISNPLFTPDVADLYVFRLIASDGVRSSITTVSLTPTPLRRRSVHP